MAGMRGRPEHLRGVLRNVAALDTDWMSSQAGRDDRHCAPWMPFPVFDFIALTAEALPESPGDRFLEIGCGIGTRMLLAQEIYGLDVSGVERVPEYAEQARALGLTVSVEDALAHKGYGGHDILWFNRPFRDQMLQRALEQRVWEQMAPGAVAMCANLESPPPSGWPLILDDWEIRRGIWRKPPVR